MHQLHRLLLLFLVSIVTACSVEVPDPEEMIRDRIEEGRQYAAERDTTGLISMVTDDFHATRDINKENLKTWMARFYLTSKSARVFIRIKEIEADWETGKVTLLMGTTNLSLKEINFKNMRGRLLHMVVHLEYVDDEIWMINQVDWRDAKPEDLTVF